MIQVRKNEAISTTVMTVEQAGILLGISRGTAYAYAQQGILPGCRRIGSRWLVSIKVLENFLDQDDATSSFDRTIHA